MTFRWKQVIAPAFAAFLLLGAAACDDGGAAGPAIRVASTVIGYSIQEISR